MIEYTMPHWVRDYAGEDISNVPRKNLESLLEWEEENGEPHPDLIEAIEDQLAIRDRSYDNF